MSKKNHFECYNFVTLMSICFMLISCVKDEHDETSGVAVGDKIPAFVVDARVSDDDDWRLEKYGSSFELTTQMFADKVGIIVFFNTECEDCQKELPELQKVYDQIKTDSAYQFICISREENEAEIKSYWQTDHLTLPYSAQNSREIYNLFASTLIPRIYIIDRKGVIRSIHTDKPLANCEMLLEEIVNF